MKRKTNLYPKIMAIVNAAVVVRLDVPNPSNHRVPQFCSNYSLHKRIHAFSTSLLVLDTLLIFCFFKERVFNQYFWTEKLFKYLYSLIQASTTLVRASPQASLKSNQNLSYGSLVSNRSFVPFLQLGLECLIK
jgi:hypothetical protein